MQNAAALTDAPAPIGATSLDPYGQLIKMLLPRANSIVIYDRLGVALWASDGFDDPDLQRVIRDSTTSAQSHRTACPMDSSNTWAASKPLTFSCCAMSPRTAWQCRPGQP
jgi:hypothetical protein